MHSPLVLITEPDRKGCNGWPATTIMDRLNSQHLSLGVASTLPAMLPSTFSIPRFHEHHAIHSDLPSIDVAQEAGQVRRSQSIDNVADCVGVIDNTLCTRFAAIEAALLTDGWQAMETFDTLSRQGECQ